MTSWHLATARHIHSSHAIYATHVIHWLHALQSSHAIHSSETPGDGLRRYLSQCLVFVAKMLVFLWKSKENQEKRVFYFSISLFLIKCLFSYEKPMQIKKKLGSRSARSVYIYIHICTHAYIIHFRRACGPPHSYSLHPLGCCLDLRIASLVFGMLSKPSESLYRLWDVFWPI